MNTIPVIADNCGTKMLLVVFGRDESVDVLLTNVLASRRHCESARTNKRLVLTDLGSVNGTMINGRLVDERVLKSGDQFTTRTRVFDVESIDDTSSVESACKLFFGGVARVLRLLGRKRVSSDGQIVSAVADRADEQFN